MAFTLSPLPAKTGYRYFELTSSYDTLYKWFDYPKANGQSITGYVLLPHHLHLLIGFTSLQQSIHTVVSNAKRLIAYAIVKRLEAQKQTDTWIKLSNAVSNSDRQRGKLHQEFEPSFDAKECRSRIFIEQKLTYIHNNPCRGVWNLSTGPVDYLHSPACFYYTGKQGIDEVTNYMELEERNSNR